MTWRIVAGDAESMLPAIPPESVQACVTSPPNFGLRSYVGVSAAVDPGAQRTVPEYVAMLTRVLDEVRRVLVPSGTLWLVLGDSYASSLPAAARRQVGLSRKDLIGMPWRVAFALQAAGWHLRREIVWHKPNVIPESVDDRPTCAHEYVFLLAKSDRYFYDGMAIQEPAVTSRWPGIGPGHGVARERGERYVDMDASARRQARSVWTIPTEGYRGPHFAPFPKELAKRCILAGTPATGVCERCGAPQRRVVEGKGARREEAARSSYHPESKAGRVAAVRETARANGAEYGSEARTLRWEPSCGCGAGVVPAVVLDPFVGSGTTGVVAQRLGRDFSGIEASNVYVAMARERIANDAPVLQWTRSPQRSRVSTLMPSRSGSHTLRAGPRWDEQPAEEKAAQMIGDGDITNVDVYVEEE